MIVLLAAITTDKCIMRFGTKLADDSARSSNKYGRFDLGVCLMDKTSGEEETARCKKQALVARVGLGETKTKLIGTKWL